MTENLVTGKRTFGTFAGVFTPTTLTILGVIMFIRQPWVVGNAGVAGAIVIVGIAVIITLSTALSLSSITTNIRIGSGGAFSLIAHSLGLEIGGAIGIPFYFAQAVAVAMYIFGFREGIQVISPELNPLLLDAGIFAMVMLISFISTCVAGIPQRISIKLLAIRNADPKEQERLNAFMHRVTTRFREIGIPISFTFVSGSNLNDTLNLGMQSLSAAFFKPNTIFFVVDTELHQVSVYEQLKKDAITNNYSIIFYIPFSTLNLVIEKNLVLWLEHIPSEWKETFSVGNNDLSILASLLICRNWKGQIHVNIIRDKDPRLFSTAEELEAFKDMVRFPKNTLFNLIDEPLETALQEIRVTDLNIFSISEGLTMEKMINRVTLSRTSAIFCHDSGFESALV